MGALELDVEELLSRRDVLEATVLASAVPRRSVPVNEQPVREVGRQLFHALFTGPVYGTYRASLGVAQQRGKRLRLVLRLTAPELAALPWEMLFDPETETYLCRQEPLVRHVHAPYTADPLEVRPPLRILGLVASPRGLQALDVEAEKDHLAEALAVPVAEGLVELVWVPEATWDGVHARLLAGEWHVLHFVGHGDYDTRTDEGVLALVGRDGRADMIEAGRLADLLGEAQPTPRLVVLNSCSSGQAGANDLFSGTAAALVRSGINAVAAMQFAVSDIAAIAFARGFYTAIAHGRSVDEAARSGRISILGAPRSLEWVTPVLYVRGQATQLFTLTLSRAGDRENPLGHQATGGDQSPPAVQATETARHRQAELSALYVAARAELRLGHFDAAIGLFDDLLILDPGYRDVAGLRDTARLNRQLAHTYTLATAAEDAGDWIAAARGYEEILRIDPEYREAVARKEACQARQRVADLHAELRHHAAAGQWQAVLDVDAELTRLDPSSSDPDGLATLARATLAAEQRAADLERRYAQARVAEDSGNWAAAARGYEEILRIDPEYREAVARKEACQARQRVADLHAELRHHAAAGQWQAVLDVDAELTRLDPSSSDPDGLATLARATLAAEQRAADLERRYAQARVAEDSGNWAAAARGYEEILRIDPEYRHAAARRDLCRQAARLQSELDQQAAAKDWPRVLATIKELTELDPMAAAKPYHTELAARARHEIASHPAEPLWRIDGSEIVKAVSWHPDGRRIAVAYEKGIRVAGKSAAVWVYDISGREPKEQLAIKGTDHITGVTFSPTGTRLATCGFDKMARVWDASSGGKLLEVRHVGVVTTVAFSPDGTRLATSSWDQSAQVWDAASGRKLRAVSHELSALRRAIDTQPRTSRSSSAIPKRAVHAVAFSPDGTRLATGSADKSARVWDAASGRKLLEILHDGGVRAMAFSPDGRRLATGTDNRTAWVWDAASGKKLLEVRHDGAVRAMAFSPDGTRLATGSADKSARVWDAASGRKLLEIRHDGEVTTVAFSPDGRQLATGSADKSVRIWPVAEL